MRLVKSSSTKVSGASEVPWFLVKLIFIKRQVGVFVLDHRVSQC